MTRTLHPVVVLVRSETGSDINRDWWSMTVRGTGLTTCAYGLRATEELFCADVEEALDRYDDGDLRRVGGVLLSLLHLRDSGRLRDELLEARAYQDVP